MNIDGEKATKPSLDFDTYFPKLMEAIRNFDSEVNLRDAI